MKHKILSLSIVALTFLISCLVPALSVTCNAQQAKLDKSLLVTGHSTKFKWIDWKKAPEAMKEATKLIQTDYKDHRSLYEKIQSDLSSSQPPTIELALIDLNNDHMAGIAVLVSGGIWCGSEGCFYEFYENAGMLIADLNDYDPRPVLNGIKLSSKAISRFRRNPNSKYKTNAEVPAIFKL